MKFVPFLALILGSVPVFAANDPFAEGVRSTEPLAQELQQKTFQLPPGFAIQLVAAEPELRKPMNMAFDGAGRLWITESREYPWPTNTAPRDTIRIFSDFDANGRAGKVTTFATNLNIPIGLYPFQTPASDGSKKLTWKCIAWSIPNIWLFEDTDGDGVADKKEKLLGSFDHTRDTHGNQSSFRRGFDGWIYATHGFNNRSTAAGRDGHQVVLPSGNAYRFRPDGARIEHWTHGQVNPFGLTFDGLGNLYSADCHSSPIYQLLRGGFYPSFGAPDDGLGFAPPTIQHSHGSTAIAGILMLDDPSWPEEFRGNLLIGNVMTSRINRDRIEWRGSTSVGHEMPDFLSTTDPWFRPVDLQLGPDGALWIADFYNRIIGHYEVPLVHPGRDRERGRIWRIVPPAGASLANLRLNSNSPDALASELMSPNRPRRMLAMNALADQFGPKVLATLRPAARGQWHFRAGEDRAALMTSALWLLQRMGALDDETLAAALRDQMVPVRVHALRILTERSLQATAMAELAGAGGRPSGLNATLRAAAVSALLDLDANVQRAAADALGANSSEENIAPLVALLSRAPAPDSHLRHVIRIALRDCLAGAKSFSTAGLDEKTSRALADIAPAVTNAAAALLLLDHVRKYEESRAALTRYLKHIARFLPAAQFDTLAGFVRGKFAEDLDLQLALFISVQEGAAQRGLPLRGATRDWGAELATRLLAPASSAVWVNSSIDGATDARSPWAFQERPSADGQKTQLMSSFPNGESLTGTLRSVPFTLPARLRFYLAGHDGSPDKPAFKKNGARLRDAQTQAILREAWPPRNDTAQLISWELAEFAGRRGYVEVTDADAGSAYAWLAFGRFEPALPELALGNSVAQRQQTAADICRTLGLVGNEPLLLRLATNRVAGTDARFAAARALVSFHPLGPGSLFGPTLAALTVVLNDGLEPLALREKFAAALGEMAGTNAGPALLDAFKASPARLQTALATALAANPANAELLLAAVAVGRVPARLLQERVLQDKLAAAKVPDLEVRVIKLTRDLPPADEARQKLIDQRRKIFATASGRPEQGRAVFVKNCAACHQLDGEGALVGPQLDGLGGRGAERVMEDILDPNRNVDGAFRTTTLVLNDGDVLSGLLRREEGELLIYAESSGKEQSVPKKNIKERHPSELSLMPDNFADVIPAAEFNDLIAFLLTKTATQK